MDAPVEELAAETADGGRDFIQPASDMYNMHSRRSVPTNQGWGIVMGVQCIRQALVGR